MTITTDYNSMIKAGLEAELKRRGQSSSGSKQELINRLMRLNKTELIEPLKLEGDGKLSNLKSLFEAFSQMYFLQKETGPEHDFLKLLEGRRRFVLLSNDQSFVYPKLVEILNSSENYVAGVGPTFPVIDAAGPGRRVFQVTGSPNHGMKKNGAINLMKSAGFLDIYGKRSPGCSTEVLEFYWFVLPKHFESWANKDPISCPVEEDSDADYCWKEYVVQYTVKPSKVQEHEN
jgi:hypothetical protein